MHRLGHFYTHRIPMDNHLAITSGDPLPPTYQRRAIEARVHANRDRSLFRPNAGRRVYRARDRTAEEQAELERDLRVFEQQAFADTIQRKD